MFQEISDQNSSSRYWINKIEDVERVNPIEHFKKTYVYGRMNFHERFFEMNYPGISSIESHRLLIQRIYNEWEEHLNKGCKKHLPINLDNLFNAKRKSEQEKIWRDIKMTSEDYWAFIVQAYDKFGYTMSSYRADHNHKGLVESELPKLFHIDNGQVVVLGETTLTQGQLKQAIQHRKVTVSKFFDKDENWHCLFLTFASLKGEEKYKNGKPHLHYISNKWGLPRTSVVSQLTSEKYRLPSLPHIDFERTE
jgi:hypothetical protein